MTIRTRTSPRSSALPPTNFIALGYDDTTISGSLKTRTFEVVIEVDRTPFLDTGGWVDLSRLLTVLDAAVRSASHAAGVSTPGWEPLPLAPRFERLEINVREPASEPIPA